VNYLIPTIYASLILYLLILWCYISYFHYECTTSKHGSGRKNTQQSGDSPYPLAHLWMHQGRCKLLSVGRSSDRSAILGDKFLIPTLLHFILGFLLHFLNFCICIHNKLSQNNEIFQDFYL